MRLLLDTHVWYWAVESPEKFGKRCTQALENADNELFVATVSTLEVGQLIHAGRMELKGTLESWARRGLQSLEIGSIELTHRIAALAYDLPGEFHKDPADRILVATAIDQGLTLATADERILRYPHVLSLDATR